MNNLAPITQKNYDLILHLLPILERMPRKQKFLIADRIQNKLLDNQEKLIKAYFSQDKVRKKHLLQDLNSALEQLRFLIRLCLDTKLLSLRQYGYISERIDEIGKMNGGWLKSL